MRIDDDLLEGDAASSGQADRLDANVFRGGELLAEHLDVSGFSIGWDETSHTQGQATFTFADPSGTLAPWAIDEALAPGGSRLQLTWVSGASGIEVPLGDWRIRSADPEESWRVMAVGGGERLVPSGGSTVSVKADEETATAIMDRLDAEVVPAGATCLGEVERLLDGIVPVIVDEGVLDKPVPSSLVYEQDRMQAVADHIARCEARWRMGPGALEVVPSAPQEPVWTIAGGETGVLIQLGRSMSDEGLYNAAVSSSQETGDGVQLVGRHYLTDGPLAYDGPFGRVPIFHQSPATTQTGVDKDALTLLTNRFIGGEVVLTVSCLLHPGLQINDWVTLVPPSLVDGLELVGRVVSMTMGSASGGVVSRHCSLGVAVATDDLAVLARRVRRGR